jgi:hypothetical protein
VDTCNYQLVDQYDHRVVQTYWNQVCNTGYDSCSVQRDQLNYQMNDNRYFCAETYRDYGFDYSTPSYDDTYYQEPTRDESTTYSDERSDCSDNDGDGYCDEGSY